MTEKESITIRKYKQRKTELFSKTLIDTLNKGAIALVTSAPCVRIVECLYNGGCVPYSAFACFHDLISEDSEQTDRCRVNLFNPSSCAWN